MVPYDLFKALHVAAAITFVGGVLAAAMLIASIQTFNESSPDGRRIALHLHRWQRLVTTPAMLVVWGLGLTLALQGGWFSHAWLQAKLVLVVLLSGVHGVQSGLLRRLAKGGSVAARSRWSGSGVPLTIGLVTGIAVLVVAVH